VRTPDRAASAPKRSIGHRRCLACVGRLAGRRGGGDAAGWSAGAQAIAGGQIARAYLGQKLLSLEKGFFGSVAGGAADALLGEVLTPETVAARLSQRRLKADAPDAGTPWGMPPLSKAFGAGPLRAVMNSRFDGPLSFVVGLDSPEGCYRVHLNLSGTTLATVRPRRP
jgi:hypothetical protein